MKIFKLPDLGEGLPDAEIHEWYVKEGDEIKADENMVSMETAKAVVDVPAPRSGKIAKLYGKSGDVINTGAPLVEFTDAGEEETASPDATATASETKADANAATVAGAIEVGNRVIKESATGITPTQSGSGQRIKAVPAARVLAKRLNIDLTRVIGSGAAGTIRLADVEQAAKQGGATLAPTAPQTRSAPKAGYEPVRGVRRAMAQAMSESHAQVVPVTLNDDANLSHWISGNDITLRVIRAIAAGCKTEPGLNAHYDGAANALKLNDTINLGLAMDSPDGLFVPVLKDIGNRDGKTLRDNINRYKQEVKDRAIAQDDLRDPTLTLSNFGMFAGRYANPVIVPPTVAILGTGRLYTTAAINAEGEAVQQRLMPLSLTFDHRACTGGEAARFLASVIKDLELAE